MWGALALPFCISMSAANTASWLNPVDGNWTDATKWSTNPAYPNNGFPTSSTYDVLINNPDGTFQIVEQTAGSVAVNSATLNSPNATLSINAGAFRAINGLLIDRGNFVLNGGTLLNTTILGVPDRIDGYFAQLNKGVLDGVTIRAAASMFYHNPGDPPLNVRNGLTIDGTTVGLASVQFDGTQTLAGNGILSVGFLHVNGNLTISPETTLLGGTFNYAGSTATNFGTMRASPTDRLHPFWFEAAGGGIFNNRGLVEAPTGSYVLFEYSFNNTGGTFRASGGQIELRLNSVYNTAALGTLDTGTGTIILSGPVQNAGSTILSNSPTGKFVLASTITGGTLTSVPGAEFNIDSNATLNNLTVNGNLSITPPDFAHTASLNANSITLNNSKIFMRGVSSSGAAGLDLTGFLNGSGEILFQNSDRNGVGGSSVIVSSGIVIRTDSGGGEVNGIINRGLILAQTTGRTISSVFCQNEATIDVKNGSTLATRWLTNLGTVTVDASNVSFGEAWDNAGGTIRVSSQSNVTMTSAPAHAGFLSIDHSTLTLNGNFITAQIAPFSVTDSAIFLPPAAIINNTNDNYTLGNRNTFTFTGGRINGGTISAASSAEVYSVKGSGTLGAVNLAAPITVLDGSTLFVSDGLGFSGSSISLASGIKLAELRVSTNSTISGVGEIVFDGSGPAGRFSANNGMIIGSGVVVRTGANSGIVGQTTTPFTNRGTISAQTSGKNIQINGTNWLNDTTGIIEAKNGGSLTLNGSWSNTGLISATDSVIDVRGSSTASGAFSLVRARLNLFVSFNSVGLNNPANSSSIVDVIGSTLTNTDHALALSSSTLALQMHGGTITGGTLSGNEGEIHVYSGTNTINSATMSTNILVDPGATLTMGGTWSNTTGTITTTNANVTLNGSGSFTTANLGTIHRTGGTLAIGGQIINNNSTIDATQLGGEITFRGSVIGGTLLGSENARFIVTGSSARIANLNLGAPLVVSAGSPLTLANTITFIAGGRIALNGSASSSSPTNLFIDFFGTTSGSAEISFSGDSSNSVINTPTNPTFSFPSGLTIRSAGQGGAIAGSQITMNGALLAMASAKTITVRPTRFTLGEGGIVAASAGGTISIPSTTTLGNLSNGILTGGSWQVYGGSKIVLTGAAITTNAATILLSGPNSLFDAILNLRSNTSTFSITDNRDFSTTAAFSNSGLLSIGPASTLSTTFPFTEAAGSNLKFILCSAVPDQGFGNITGDGSAALAGQLSVELCPGYQPSEGDTFPIISLRSISGGFDSYSFPQMGALGFEVESTPSAITLHVVAVPEAGICMTFAMFLPTLARRRR